MPPAVLLQQKFPIKKCLIWIISVKSISWITRLQQAYACKTSINLCHRIHFCHIIWYNWIVRMEYKLLSWNKDFQTQNIPPFKVYNYKFNKDETERWFPLTQLEYWPMPPPRTGLPETFMGWLYTIFFRYASAISITRTNLIKFY